MAGGDAEADDRTEAPTPRRLEKAREEGRVALSKEAGSFASLAGAAIGLALASGQGARELSAGMAALLGAVHDVDPATADHGLLRDLALSGLRVVLTVAAPAALLGAAAVLLQTRLLVSARTLRPDFSRINPLAGARRLVGVQNLAEFAKAVAKLALLGIVVWHVLGGGIDRLADAALRTPAAILDAAKQDVARVLLALLVALCALATLDVVWQRFQLHRQLRMSRDELRQESKDTDGNPVVKGRLKQLREQRARKRMISAVKTAHVVVTNPTHYAVALRYDRARQGAPRVVAKGADAMAARIRDAAREARVPLVANPPLARALHRLELDTEIPPEHYQAVAEVIAYIWRLKGRTAA